MTLVTVVNTARVTIATDELIVPSEQVHSLSGAIETARALTTLHEQESARVRAAEHAARERGQRDGFAEGRAAAAAEFAEQLAALQERTEREREAVRRRMTENALGVVRRIAATLGEERTLAALAIEAARDIVPIAGLTVQVRPEMLEAVRERLRESRGESAFAAALAVEADESLEAGQCRLRGADGLAVLAGLETQLRNLERLTRRQGAATGAVGIDAPATSRAAPAEPDAPA